MARDRKNQVLDDSKRFAIRIINLYKYLNGEKKEFLLSKQVLKSGTSFGANIRESVYAQSTSDFISNSSFASMLFKWEITPRRGNEQTAQGNALGKQQVHIVRPVGATALNMYLEIRAFALAGRDLCAYIKPRALPWAISLSPLQGVGYASKCPELVAYWPLHKSLTLGKIRASSILPSLNRDFQAASC